MKKVVIYTGPMCNFCSAAKHLLNKKKINYEEIDIGYDDQRKEEMLQMELDKHWGTQSANTWFKV